MNDLEILALIERGDLTPLSQDDLTRGAAFCLRVSAKTPSVLAVVVAKLRKDHITDVTEWSRYCKETFGLKSSYLHHIHKVGKYLHSVISYTPAVYSKLFHLAFEKLLSIVQIPVAQIDSFIKGQTKPLGKMTRAEVRAAVRLFLEETGSPVKHQEKKSRFNLSRWLENTDFLEEEALQEAINDNSAAERSFIASGALFAAALAYQKRQDIPDTELLAEVKAGLLEDVADIERILAQE
ncbi:MAG: hypothetical protein IKB99_03195 [Lentisphaeria bacterium]|nr:hypothetical protein [Lentisphaeria bacterium]